MFMTCRAHFQLRCRLLSGMAVIALAAVTGCQGSFSDPVDRPGGGPTGAGATGNGTGNPTGGNATTGGSTTGTTGTGSGGSAGTGTTGTGGAGGGTGGAGGAGGTGPGACTGPDLAAPKRLIRLTFNQLINSIGSLFDSAL